MHNSFAEILIRILEKELEARRHPAQTRIFASYAATSAPQTVVSCFPFFRLCEERNPEMKFQVLLEEETFLSFRLSGTPDRIRTSFADVELRQSLDFLSSEEKLIKEWTVTLDVFSPQQETESKSKEDLAKTIKKKEILDLVKVHILSSPYYAPGANVFYFYSTDPLRAFLSGLFKTGSRIYVDYEMSCIQDTKKVSLIPNFESFSNFKIKNLTQESDKDEEQKEKNRLWIIHVLESSGLAIPSPFTFWTLIKPRKETPKEKLKLKIKSKLKPSLFIFTSSISFEHFQTTINVPVHLACLASSLKDHGKDFFLSPERRKLMNKLLYQKGKRRLRAKFFQFQGTNEEVDLPLPLSLSLPSSLAFSFVRRHQRSKTKTKQEEEEENEENVAGWTHLLQNSLFDQMGCVLGKERCATWKCDNFPILLQNLHSLTTGQTKPNPKPKPKPHSSICAGCQRWKREGTYIRLLQEEALVEEHLPPLSPLSWGSQSKSKSKSKLEEMKIPNMVLRLVNLHPNDSYFSVFYKDEKLALRRKNYLALQCILFFGDYLVVLDWFMQLETTTYALAVLLHCAPDSLLKLVSKQYPKLLETKQALFYLQTDKDKDTREKVKSQSM